MQGSPNPLIIRNYRMIPPTTWKYYNLWDNPQAFQGQHIPDRDINLVFKVEAAPVVLPYESELVLKFTFLSRDDKSATRISNQWAPKPLYRVKAKSMAHIIKRCWATISNMTFQSYRPPLYLNEILLRKPAPLQMKYPDNYTGEKSIYLSFNGDDPQSMQNPNAPRQCYLEPLTRSCPNEGQLYFMTPQFINTKQKTIGAESYYENTLTFRIPFTELLPVFKIGVIPLIMIASNSFDMWIDIHNPKGWFVNCGIGEVAALETYLNVTTVSFPDINPLAEALIRPRIFDGRFIAPFLDYLTFENTFVLNHPETQFFFNITQFLRNVPFAAITFTDETDYPLFQRINGATYEAPDPIGLSIDDTQLYKGGGINVAADAVGVTEPNFVTGRPDLTVLTEQQRKNGGFFSLPPNVHCEDLKIMLGESAFPLTQVPMNWDDMYMYNRKHFEMYGRDFNIYRVSPIGRAHSGDASFFFDLSHAPMTGFQIGPASPLQVMGKLKKISSDATQYRVTVTLTCYYSHNFNAMLASGGVVPLQ